MVARLFQLSRRPHPGRKMPIFTVYVPSRRTDEAYHVQRTVRVVPAVKDTFDQDFCPMRLPSGP